MPTMLLLQQHRGGALLQPAHLTLNHRLQQRCAGGRPRGSMRVPQSIR